MGLSTKTETCPLKRKAGFQDSNSDATTRKGSSKDNSDTWGGKAGSEDKSNGGGRKKSFQDKSGKWEGKKSLKNKSDIRGGKNGFESKSVVFDRKNGLKDKSDVWGRGKSFGDKFDIRGAKKGLQDKSDEWGRGKIFKKKSDLFGRKKLQQDKSDEVGSRKGFEDKSDVWGWKKGFENKSDVVDQKKHFQNKFDVEGRKKGTEEKYVDLDSRPKRKKKVSIRIDPADISNKRLDDETTTDGNVAQKKVDPEKELELSKNAQFRAIWPDPSILSFVEDNLLGRRRLLELRRAGYNIDLSTPLDNIPLSTSSERERIEDPVKEYVSTRVGLKRVCLLIDTKWGMKPRDHELIDLMERSQTKYQVVLTKTDVVFPMDVARRAMQIEETLKANKSLVQPVMMVSSKSGAGIRTLRTVLSKVMRFAKV